MGFNEVLFLSKLLSLKLLSFCVPLETHFLISQNCLFEKFLPPLLISIALWPCVIDERLLQVFGKSQQNFFVWCARGLQANVRNWLASDTRQRALEFYDLSRLWTRQHPIPTYKKQNNTGLDYQDFVFIDTGFIKILCRKAQSWIEFWVA